MKSVWNVTAYAEREEGVASLCMGRARVWNVVAMAVEAIGAGEGEGSGQAGVAGEESCRWVYSGHYQQLACVAEKGERAADNLD